MTDAITMLRAEDLHARPNARATDAALVEQIAGSMRVIGFRPEKPIVVVRDGNIYWVIDGEHRRQAALASGIEDVPCAVEDLDDAGVLTYEGALNVQRPDTEREKWQRAQGFLALGDAAVPEAVQVATGFGAEAWSKIRKAARLVADQTAFEDMDPEWAESIAECKDDAKRAALIAAKPSEWRSIIAPPAPPAPAPDDREPLYAFIAAHIATSRVLKERAHKLWDEAHPLPGTLADADGFTARVLAHTLSRLPSPALKALCVKAGYKEADGE